MFRVIRVGPIFGREKCVRFGRCTFGSDSYFGSKMLIQIVWKWTKFEFSVITCQMSVLIDSNFSHANFWSRFEVTLWAKNSSAKQILNSLNTLFRTKNRTSVYTETWPCDTNLREFSTPEQGPNRWNGSLFSPIIETPSPAAPIGLFNLSGKRLKYSIKYISYIRNSWFWKISKKWWNLVSLG